MITFKQFLIEDVVASKRKSMMHLQSMKPVEFVQWVKSIDADLGGILTNLNVTLKVDGLGARFGKDKNGRLFFEGSRTGPIFEPKSFSNHAKSKGSSDEIVARAAHYDDMFDLLKGSSFVKSLPADTKVICEIFYNPMATEKDGKLTFVTVQYDKSKLGKVMTIVPIDVLSASTGEPHPNAASIIQGLYKASGSDLKVVNPELTADKIDVRAKIKSILKFGERELSVIKSLKAADKPEKALLIKAIDDAKNDLAQHLLDHPGIVGKDKLGKDIEGLVFSINGQPVKVTTQEFKDSKKKA